MILQETALILWVAVYVRSLAQTSFDVSQAESPYYFFFLGRLGTVSARYTYMKGGSTEDLRCA